MDFQAIKSWALRTEEARLPRQCPSLLAPGKADVRPVKAESSAWASGKASVPRGSRPLICLPRTGPLLMENTPSLALIAGYRCEQPSARRSIITHFSFPNGFTTYVYILKCSWILPVFEPYVSGNTQCLFFVRLASFTQYWDSSCYCKWLATICSFSLLHHISQCDYAVIYSFCCWPKFGLYAVFSYYKDAHTRDSVEQNCWVIVTVYLQF